MDFLNDSVDEEEGEESGFKINTAYAERYGIAGVYIVHFETYPTPHPTRLPSSFPPAYLDATVVVGEEFFLGFTTQKMWF